MRTHYRRGACRLCCQVSSAPNVADASEPGEQAAAFQATDPLGFAHSLCHELAAAAYLGWV
jgi:hypothetical protein